MNELDRALQAISDHKKALVGVVVHLNDTYLIDARPERWLPGFARIIATIRRLRAHTIAATGNDLVLVVHSGDFLSPSRVGNYKDTATKKYDHGRTMVSLLNAAGVKYCVLGNHEFDNKANALADRLREANFTVLLANTTDPTGLIRPEDPSPGNRHIKMKPHVVWPEDDSRPRIALTGVVSADVHKSFVSPSLTEKDPKTGKPKDQPWKDTSPSQAVIKAWNDIKDRADDTSPGQGGEFETKVALTDNVPFRFVLTHATQDEDTQLQRQIAATPRTYILGGHDHDIQYVDYSGTIFIGKNLSNAETIRVMLPLAGGRSACNEVYAAYQRLQKRQPNKRFLYPQDLEAVLLTVSDLDSDVLRERIQEQNAPEGSELKDVLNKARCEYDIPAFELTYEDHDMSDVAADEIIQAAIAKVELSDDDKLVRNFTGITALEARDHYIRKDATNMGVLVAECVRREAEAQLNQKGHRPAGAPAPVIALINSGAFRCDSELKPELKLRDLRETFLYDDDRAIMVLKVSAEVVRDLVKHGTQETKKGTGAYPQLAGGWKTAKGDVWLAISSFLLIRADNNDGYNDVLQRFWKLPDAEATAEKALKEASDVRFSITDAVKNNAQAVPANKLPKQARKTVKGEAEILRLLQAYLKAFHENISPDDSNFSNKETWLESKVHIDQPAIREARDAVRGFLEERGTVKKYKDVAATLNKGAQWKDDARVAWTNARKELLELRGSLRSKDDPAFSTGDSYFRLFNAAVRGIPGWGLLPALT